LLNKEGVALARRPEQGWQALVKEATFTTVATEIQGALATIAPNCKYIINDTIWNRTQQRPICGSLDAKDWAVRKGWLVSGGFYQEYRLKGGNISFIPIPTAGETCAFEYQSSAWTTNGSTFSTAFTADTDTSLLDEELLRLGLIWRWRAAKGFDYSEDFREYEVAVSEAIARDTPKQTIVLGRKSHGLLDVNVQEGNYPAS
jgi:hypothetical protein